MQLRRRADGAAGRARPLSRFVRGTLISVLSLAITIAVGEVAARLVGFRPDTRRAAAFRWNERGELFLMLPGRSRTAMRGLDVEVVNASVPGWSRREQRLFLEKLGRRLAPDLVIFTVVLNDLRELRTSEDRLRWSVYAVGALDQATRHSALALAFKSALAAAARPADEFRNVLDLYRRMDESTDDPEVRAALDLERTETEALLRIARQRGYAVGAILVPMSFQLEPDHDPALQRELRAFLDERGVPVLDLLPVLRPLGADAVFLDHVHLNERGHRQTANALVAMIDAQRLLSRPKATGSAAR